MLEMLEQTPFVMKLDPQNHQTDFLESYTQVVKNVRDERRGVHNLAEI